MKFLLFLIAPVLCAPPPYELPSYGTAPPAYGSAPAAPPSYGSAPSYTTPAPTYTTAAPSYTTGASYTTPSSYTTAPSYGQKCKTYYETIQVDKCEKYSEKVCYTTQQETCNDVVDQNCRAITASQQIRQCFNVTELKCGLKEDVQYETVQAVFTVQKCHTVTERVCDTVYETVETSKDAFQCITVKNPVCSSYDQTLYDKTCRTTTKFDCNYGSYGYGDDSAPAPSGGYGNVPAYGSAPAAGNDAYGGESYCKRSQNTQCYNTPRVVNTEQCAPKDQQICEKLVNVGPQPKEKQVCHNEEKKVCELEQRSQPKQIKKYVYTTACQSVPRSVCDNADIKTLVPSCVPITRKTCTYAPVEKCEDIPKDYCYKYPKKIAKQKCYSAGYGDNDEGTYEN